MFAEFARTGSADGVVALCGRPFPLRAYGGVWDGQLRWGKLTHGRVLGVLTNPAYAGAYVYGRYRTRRTVQPDGAVITTYPRVPRPGQRRGGEMVGVRGRRNRVMSLSCSSRRRFTSERVMGPC
ncbi:recombinase family protein [Streptomyces blastmyceticus]|uniref:Recombinase domain-containing protein n=1 Tax=Streptomyces blastmyceticus TaxID=68180 RepID=A0ABN0Y1M4_9ACTN